MTLQAARCGARRDRASRGRSARRTPARPRITAGGESNGRLPPIAQPVSGDARFLGHEMENMYQTALRILEDPGARVLLPEARRLYGQGGARGRDLALEPGCRTFQPGARLPQHHRSGARTPPRLRARLCGTDAADPSFRRRPDAHAAGRGAADPERLVPLLPFARRTAGHGAFSAAEGLSRSVQGCVRRTAALLCDLQHQQPSHAGQHAGQHGGAGADP